ncbi:MAG: DegT/DnrJ/EryC1/StrS family aminotransferase [Vicinamibacterales bacterium]
MPGFELIDDREREAVNEVFDRGGVFFRHGFDAMRRNIFKVREFEDAFARALGARYAQSVTSGTAALKVGLKALGIGPGDEVVTQAHTFVATVEAILECGATPIVSDIDWTLNMDPSDLERRITPRTKAIIPVHMLGGPARLAEITRIADARGIPVLEDTAQGLGGQYRGKWLGTIAKVGTFSFDHGKVLTTGEGGMVVTDDEEIFLRARAYHDHGHESNPNFPRGEDTRQAGGFNYRMMELQGAIGLVQLSKLPHALERQRANKAQIKRALARIPGIRFRELPDEPGDAGDCLVFFLETPEAAKTVAGDLAKQGIGFKNLPGAVDWHFAGTWDHLFTGHPVYGTTPASALWPESERILRSAIALPIMVKMEPAQIDKLITNVTRVLEAVCQ